MRASGAECLLWPSGLTLQNPTTLSANAGFFIYSLQSPIR